MQARVKRKLPDAPSPTKPIKVNDFHEIEKSMRMKEHREFRENLRNPSTVERKEKRPDWDEAKTNKLVKLWRDGMKLNDIAEQVKMPIEKTRSRVKLLMSKGLIKPRKAHLSEDDKAKVYKLYMAGEKPSEIASDMHVTTSAINKTIRKAKEKEKK